MNGRPTARLLLLWLALAAVQSFAASTPQAIAPDRVLILNSYHPGNLWSDAELEGVLGTLKKGRPDAEVFIEYLDWQRNPDKTQPGRVADYLRERYRGVPFPVVIALDQFALDLLAANRTSLFPAAQVAFCGVEVVPAIQGPRWFTGVREVSDPVGAVFLAMRLQPELKHLFIFHTRTATALQLRDEILGRLPGLKEQMSIEALTNAPLPELLRVVDQLDSAAILMMPSNDLPPVQAALAARSPVPLYGMQSPNQLASSAGGSFSDGQVHGTMAARLAMRLLAGESAGQIPIEDAPPRLVVDHAAAERLHLALSGLPAKVEVLNRPPTFWQREGPLVLGSAAIIGALSLVVAALGWTVGQKRRAETALRASEQRYRLLVENSNDVVTEVSAAGTMLFCTANVATVLGHTADEVVGSDAFALVHPEDVAKARASFELPRGTLTFRVRNKDGSWRWIEASSQRFRGGSDEERVVLVSRDVTERIAAEQEHKRLEAHLRQAKKLEALGTLAGGIAHDFNNLLTAILGNTGLLKADLAPGPVASQGIAQIERAAFRARDLIQQVLTFSRAQSTQRQPVALGPLIDEASGLIRSTAPATVQIINTCSGSLPTVLGDPTQLHQVLLNLCTNAVQAMGPTGGHLELSAQAVELDGTFCRGHPPLRPGSYVRLTVRDSGPGMDKATISRIFEPFFTTKGPGRGTGLGLAVVDGIVAGHEGAITVESSPGRGTSFVVHLPATTATALGASAPEPDLPRGHGENILLVDDDPLITEVGQRLLGTIGYSACVFRSPEEALHEFRCRPKDFALVITDLTMPGMNGLALARELLSVRPEQPILLVTGFGGTTDEAAVRRAGLRGILAKPFDLRRLATEIQRCLTVDATA